MAKEKIEKRGSEKETGVISIERASGMAFVPSWMSRIMKGPYRDCSEQLPWKLEVEGEVVRVCGARNGEPYKVDMGRPINPEDGEIEVSLHMKIKDLSGSVSRVAQLLSMPAEGYFSADVSRQERAALEKRINMIAEEEPGGGSVSKTVLVKRNGREVKTVWQVNGQDVGEATYVPLDIDKAKTTLKFLPREVRKVWTKVEEKGRDSGISVSVNEIGGVVLRENTVEGSVEVTMTNPQNIFEPFTTTVAIGHAQPVDAQEELSWIAKKLPKEWVVVEEQGVEGADGEKITESLITVETYNGNDVMTAGHFAGTKGTYGFERRIRKETSKKR